MPRAPAQQRAAAARGAPAAPPARPAPAAPAAQRPALQGRMHRDEDVLERRHVLEEADVLERARDARLGDLVRLTPRDRHALEGPGPRRRLAPAGPAAAARRLPR